jgi:tetratricopeptide (TPR) repeat protein
VAGTADRYGFVHSLTRQAVLDRLPHTRCTALHARVAQTLEARGDPALTPRIAHHYLAADVLGFHEQALRHTTAAAWQAVHSLAFEEAARWFDRAASLPETPEEVRAQLSFEAAANHVRAGDFARARGIYERLTTTADPLVRLEAAMGLEEATARPGLADSRAADLLAAALAGCELDPDDLLRVRALGSLGRALAFAGRHDEGREVGSQAVDAAHRSGDRSALVHALKTSLWHGLTPGLATVQLARSIELARLCAQAGARETGSVASFHRAIVSYLAGRPDDLAEAATDLHRAAESLGQPWHTYFAGCIAQGRAFCRGDFAQAEQRAAAALELGEAFGVDTTDGSYGVQMFMIHRETGRLKQPRDRRSAVHQRQHRGQPHPQHPHEDRHRQPDPGRPVRDRARARLALRELRAGPVRQQALGHLHHDVGRKPGPHGGPADRLRRRCFVQAVGLAPVGRQERVHPAHAFLVVDPVDPVGRVGARFDLICVAALDDEDGHGPALPLDEAQPDRSGRGKARAPTGVAGSTCDHPMPIPLPYRNMSAGSTARFTASSRSW